MSNFEIAAKILWALIYVILYFIIGFGPGVLIGFLLANRFGGGHKRNTMMQKHTENIERSRRHNEQWHPDHERWQN